VVSSTPRPEFTPGKDPAPILLEDEWARGPVWTGGKSRPHRNPIPERPARSQSLYRMSYPVHIILALQNGYQVFPEGKVQPRRAADHSPTSSVAVMEE